MMQAFSYDTSGYITVLGSRLITLANEEVHRYPAYGSAWLGLAGDQQLAKLANKYTDCM
jgi:hypothetical protein